MINNKRGGTISFVVSLVMVALFFVAIVTFSINFGNDNNSKVNLANDPDFVGASNDISNNMTVFYNDVNTSSTAMQESTINTQVDSTEGGTSFKVGPGTAIITSISTISLVFSKIFGNGKDFGIFLTAIISVLVFISALYIWKSWKAGSPD